MSLSAPQRGQVFIYAPDDGEFASEHECSSRLMLARQIADLKAYEFGGLWNEAVPPAGASYFVPSKALRPEEAHGLGICSLDDLFGGVVPHDFVATKAITHGLVAPHAASPPGWSHAFARAIGDVVLRGFSAFSIRDGLTAGAELLDSGPIRLKPPHATGGRGQTVATTPRELAEGLGAMDEDDVALHGVVIEENLSEVLTCSVGTVQVGAVSASYYGTQRLTRDNRGESAYGGSSLVFARGGFDALLALNLPAPARRAVHQAQRYDQAALACFSGLYASRRNYDVAQGWTAGGGWRSGVLEQSWRIGGASGAEVAALKAFQARPELRSVRAASVEIYGPCVPPPAALVYFQGCDADVGPITKYSIVEDDGHSDP